MLACSNNRGHLVYHTENYTQSYMYHKIVYPGSRFHMVAYGSGSSWHCKKEVRVSKLRQQQRETEVHRWDLQGHCRYWITEGHLVHKLLLNNIYYQCQREYRDRQTFGLIMSATSYVLMVTWDAWTYLGLHLPVFKGSHTSCRCPDDIRVLKVTLHHPCSEFRQLNLALAGWVAL